MRSSNKGRSALAAMVVLAGAVFFDGGPAASDPPPDGWMEAPPSVYSPVDETLLFAGPDPYIGHERALVVEGADPSEDCDHGDDATDGDLGPTGGPSAGCTTVQLEVNHGTLTVAGANTGSGGGTAGGAEILAAVDLPNPIFNLFGTVEEINATLATLSYEPDAGYESTLGGDGPDTLSLFVVDGAGDEVLMVDGDNEVVGDGDIEVSIWVEQPNDPPELTITIPAALRTLDASTDPGNLDSHQIRSSDPGVTITVEDPDIDDGEPNDYMLGVAWIEGDGRFGLGSSAFCVGGVTDVLTLAACPYLPEDLLPVAELLPSLPDGLDYGSSLGAYNRAIAFVAERSTVEDILGYIDYEIPAGDADDTINVLVHDLGNNGLPMTPNLVPGVAVPDPLGFDLASFDLHVRDDVNDPPVVTAPGSTTLDIGETVPIPFSVTDPDAGDGTLTATITAVGVTPSASSLSGDLASLNADLAALTATGVTAGGGSVTVVVDDGGNTPPPAEQGTATVDLLVEDPDATTTTSEDETTTTTSEDETTTTSEDETTTTSGDETTTTSGDETTTTSGDETTTTSEVETTTTSIDASSTSVGADRSTTTDGAGVRPGGVQRGPGTGGTELARTGASPTAPALVGLGLVGLGALVLALRRRTRLRL